MGFCHPTDNHPAVGQLPHSFAPQGAVRDADSHIPAVQEAKAEFAKQ
jgi:hypothetical protein